VKTSLEKEKEESVTVGSC